MMNLRQIYIGTFLTYYLKKHEGDAAAPSIQFITTAYSLKRLQSRSEILILLELSARWRKPEQLPSPMTHFSLPNVWPTANIPPLGKSQLFKAAVLYMRTQTSEAVGLDIRQTSLSIMSHLIEPIQHILVRRIPCENVTTFLSLNSFCLS